jgi:CheY-like chemotaxis protein/HPt (histidine-containing phosphotransfer) domain-containing protein
MGFKLTSSAMSTSPWLPSASETSTKGYLIKPVKQHLLGETLRTVLASERDKKSRLVTQHLIAEKTRQGLRILLAEDNPINQRLAVILLQKSGFSVDAVDNGLLAFEKAQSEAYHAILMDVQMPEMDGFEATRRIREWEGGQRHIPIIAMTAHALKEDRERCLEAGMDDYVTKPIDIKTLLKTLDRWAHRPSPPLSSEVQDTANTTPQKAAEPLLDFEDGLFGEPVSPEPADEKLPASLTEGDQLPLDLQTALPRFMNDRAFFDEMCRDLIAHLPERLVEMKTALQTRQPEALFRHAHNLKGISASFSAGPLNRVAAQIEALGKSEDLTQAVELVKALEVEVGRLCHYCAQELGIE